MRREEVKFALQDAFLALLTVGGDAANHRVALMRTGTTPQISEEMARSWRKWWVAIGDRRPVQEIFQVPDFTSDPKLLLRNCKEIMRCGKLMSVSFSECSLQKPHDVHQLPGALPTPSLLYVKCPAFRVLALLCTKNHLSVTLVNQKTMT